MRDQVRDDIRTTSENVIADADTLIDIEQRKLDPDIAPEDLERLSEQADKAARELAHKAAVEKQLVGVANAQDRLRRAGGRPQS